MTTARPSGRHRTLVLALAPRWATLTAIYRRVTERQPVDVDAPAPGLRRPTALAALIACTLGPLALVVSLPPLVRGLALLAFVLVGPGAAVVCWTRLTPVLRLSAVPATGIAVVLLATTAAATEQWWNPATLLLSLVVLTAASALSALVLPERSPAVPTQPTRPGGVSQPARPGGVSQPARPTREVSA